MLISEAFELYIHKKITSKNRSQDTVKNYRDSLSSFIRANKDILVNSLTDVHIERWDAVMAERGNKPTTRKMHLTRLRQVLRLLAKRGIPAYDPEDIEMPHTVESEIEVLRKDEIAAMIRQSDNLRDRLLISLTFSTACRISEVLSINRDDLHEEYVRVLGKFHKYRPVVLDLRTRVLLEQYLSNREDDHPALFITSQGSRMTVKRAWQIVSRTATAAGITKRVSPHILRHSHATQLMEKGVHMRVIQQHLGHRWITTTQHYTHVSDKFLVDSVSAAHEY